jgi:omega-6 fatty acid desaturase (delta-12 desaturase)
MTELPSPTAATSLSPNLPTTAEWKRIVQKYQQPSIPRAIWQILNTLVPYAALWVLMYFAVSWSWWLVIPLAAIAGGLVVRLFIIFHDCTHGSYFKSSLANDIVGYILGVLTFTPYYHWRWEHTLHHASSGNLDRRGIGDIWTLTVQEYLESSIWRRFAYKMARNPVILFVLGPLSLFLFWNRFARPSAAWRERLSVWFTNLGIVAVGFALSMVFGFKQYVLIQLIVMSVAGSAGVWMFYLQHQFDGVYWDRQDEWDYTAAALEGSSFYKLPKVLQWFTGNIGFHHIHHLSPRIPNYNLERCHRAEPIFNQVKPITFFSSLKSMTYRLWDEEARKLVGYRRAREIRRARRHEDHFDGGNNQAAA